LEAQYVLWTALREYLICMHPIMPFITAEIWQALPGGAGQDLALQLYPSARPDCLKPAAAADMIFIQEVIGTIRTIRSELNIAPSYKLTVLLRPAQTLGDAQAQAQATLLA
ncbi:MAG: class I tRNA ligase family protein, partial [Bilophila sp.]